MYSIKELINGIHDCECGKEHTAAIKDIQVGRGMVHKVGTFLKKNGFKRNLLLVSDRNCLKAAEGIKESLSDFDVVYHLYDDLRVATMERAEEVMDELQGNDRDVISVGSGSLNDICRLSCARLDRNFCIFATAPSMDGFASDTAPIVANGFKSSYAARSPQLIVADTEILAKAPKCLKSAGFGDLMAKYVGLVDWEISSLVSGEYFCRKVADITRYAADSVLRMADRICDDDPEAAGQIFESLILTGLGMSFTGNSRPASGAEHIVAHMIDSLEVTKGKLPNFHGEDVGVATIAMLEFYNRLADLDSIETHRETVNWEKVYEIYGSLSDDVRKLNSPDTILSDADPQKLKALWPEIRRIIRSVPDADQIRTAMERAGCMLTYEDAGKTAEFFNTCFRYSPYMRRRITLMRLLDMIETDNIL